MCFILNLLFNKQPNKTKVKPKKHDIDDLEFDEINDIFDEE